jgi:hypothetical protein
VIQPSPARYRNTGSFPQSDPAARGVKSRDTRRCIRAHYHIKGSHLGPMAEYHLPASLHADFASHPVILPCRPQTAMPSTTCSTAPSHDNDSKTSSIPQAGTNGSDRTKHTSGSSSWQTASTGTSADHRDDDGWSDDQGTHSDSGAHCIKLRKELGRHGKRGVPPSSRNSAVTVVQQTRFDPAAGKASSSTSSVDGGAAV